MEALLRRRSWTRQTGRVLERGGGGYSKGLGRTQATDGLEVKASKMQQQAKVHFRPSCWCSFIRLSLAASGPRCSVWDLLLWCTGFSLVGVPKLSNCIMWA